MTKNEIVDELRSMREYAEQSAEKIDPKYRYAHMCGTLTTLILNLAARIEASKKIT